MLNPVLLSVCAMLALSLMRINVVVALTLSALIGGLTAGMSISETVSAFEGGLGGGATIALSYAMLGAFAVAISKSGITDLLAQTVIKRIHGRHPDHLTYVIKYVVLGLILLMAISSQNLIPVHIAFIPILIPPLLSVFAKLRLDRRLVACVLTFGLVTPYMALPVGFGGIFLNNILLKNLHDNGLDVAASQVPIAMILPALGMVTGLLIAVFFSYRKPRDYPQNESEIKQAETQRTGYTSHHSGGHRYRNYTRCAACIRLDDYRGFSRFCGLYRWRCYRLERDPGCLYQRRAYDGDDRFYYDCRGRFCCCNESHRQCRNLSRNALLFNW